VIRRGKKWETIREMVSRSGFHIRLGVIYTFFQTVCFRNGIELSYLCTACFVLVLGATSKGEKQIRNGKEKEKRRLSVIAGLTISARGKNQFENSSRGKGRD
jgi:hypothetical protein